MKAKDVKIGGTYIAKISGKLTTVRIDREAGEIRVGRVDSYQFRHGGWHAVNVATGRPVRIRTAGKLRGPATAERERLAGRRSRLLTAEEKGLRAPTVASVARAELGTNEQRYLAEAAANRGGPGPEDEITDEQWALRHELAEDDDDA